MKLLRDEAKYAEPLAHLVQRQSGKKAGLEPIEHVWDVLSSEQQQDLIAIAQRWAERSQARHGQSF
jgi:hypothetical protein